MLATARPSCYKIVNVSARTENVALNKVIYESSSASEDTVAGNVTALTYDFCDHSVANTSASEASWFTVDLVASYRISFVEINPLPGSLCPENSLCGQLEINALWSLLMRALP